MILIQRFKESMASLTIDFIEQLTAAYNAINSTRLFRVASSSVLSVDDAPLAGGDSRVQSFGRGMFAIRPRAQPQVQIAWL